MPSDDHGCWQNNGKAFHLLVAHLVSLLSDWWLLQVVGPLLVLILADSETLITQVCPTNLIEMTRGCLRRIFSSLIPKKIFTLGFERGGANAIDDLKALYSKLDSARRHGGGGVHAARMHQITRTQVYRAAAYCCIKSSYLSHRYDISRVVYG